MNFLRQSTAVDLGLGPFIDDDGITPATGLSITQAECRLKKNNGAWAQINDATTATHEEEGWYEKEFDATDTNTVGILIVAVYISGNLAYWKEFQVVEEAVYDMFFAASATGIIGTAQTGDSFARLGAPAGASVSADVAAVKVDTAAILVDTGTTLDARIPAALVSGRMDCSVGAMAANVLTATAINADAITAAKLAADVTTEIQSGLATSSAVSTLQTSVDDLPTNAELATALGTADDAVLVAIAALNNLSAAQVNAEVDTAIQDAFNFSNGNVNANVEEINTVTITGDGQVGTEFDVA